MTPWPLVAQASLVVLAALGLASHSIAQQLDTYQARRAYLAERFSSAQTPEEKLEAMRTVVRAGPVGERGLAQIFGRFEDKRGINPDTPGLAKVVALSTSSNAVQAKGHRRELVYAQDYFADARFKVIELGKSLRRPWGNTDADLIIQHVETGRLGRVEIKEISPETQRRNLSHYKAQMDKMYLEGVSSGQWQFWINRRPIIPELEAHAARLGIVAVGDVKTGSTTRGTPFNAVRDIQDSMFRSAPSDPRTSGPMGGSAANASAAAQLPYPLHRNASMAVGGGLRADPTTAGPNLLLGDKTVAVPYRAVSTAKAAGRSFVVIGGRLLTATPYVYTLVDATEVTIAYASGDISSRELVIAGWTGGLSIAGSLAGQMGASTLALALVHPELVPIAKAAGALAGYWAGRELGVRTAEAYYEWKYEGIDQDFGRRVYAQYGLAP